MKSFRKSKSLILVVCLALIMASGFVTAMAFYVTPYRQTSTASAPFLLSLPVDEEPSWTTDWSWSASYGYVVGVPKTWHFTVEVLPGAPSFFVFHVQPQPAYDDSFVNITVTDNAPVCVDLDVNGPDWSYRMSGYAVGDRIAVNVTLNAQRAFTFQIGVYISDV